MKVLLIAVLCVAVANAGFFTDLKASLKKIGSEIKETFQKVDQGVKTTGQAFVPYAKNVGVDLLKDAAKSGVTLVENTVTDLLGNAFKNLFHIGRDTSMMEKIVSFEHNLKDMIKKGVEQFTPVMHAAFTELENMAEKVKDLDFSLPQLVKDIENVILGHQEQGNNFLMAITSSVETIKNEIFGVQKTRSTFGETLASIGTALTDVFKPAIQNIHTLLGTAGEVLKNVAHSVVATVKQSVSQLGDKLAPHLDNLKNTGAQLLQHGTDALSAIKEATGDIFGQTLANVGSSINNLKTNLEG